MPTFTLTVARIDPPKGNGKKSKIVGVAGEVVYAFPDKAGKFVPGHAYEIDYSTNDWNGKTFNNLESFQEVEAAKAASATTSSASIQAPFRTPEQMFVTEILTAYIGNGRCEPQKLTETINFIRAAWHHTFGDTTFIATKDGPRRVEHAA
jgi:hypothetical protein